MIVIEDTQLDFSDVLIKPRRSTIASRKDADIIREYKFKWSKNIVSGTGIMQANMGTIGNFEVSRKLLSNGLFACLHKHHNLDNLVPFYDSLTDDEYRRCFISVGLRTRHLDIKKIECMVDELKNHKGFPPICIDVPNGYIPQVKDFVIELRKEHPDILIMVGNVVTGDITEDLILSGADIVKVGIGSGAQCLTRKQTGCGRPQLSAVIECADAAHQVGGMICSDGGITCPGDVGKAFCAGADFVMIGSMFAGTDEADGDVVYEENISNTTKPYMSYFGKPFNSIGELEDSIQNDKTTCVGLIACIKDVGSFLVTHVGKDSLNADGTFNKDSYGYIGGGVIGNDRLQTDIKKYKKFYGMSSTLAQEKFGNGKPDYRASEGRVTKVPYVGTLQSVVDEFLGGLRSTMTYIGATRLKDVPKCCAFYKVNNQLNRTYESTTIGK